MSDSSKPSSLYGEVRQLAAIVGKLTTTVALHDSAIVDMKEQHRDDATVLASVQAWLKALVCVGSALLLILGFIGWLLSNDYLRFNNPHNQTLIGVVQPLNSTKP